jgi:hypothetical protein
MKFFVAQKLQVRIPNKEIDRLDRETQVLKYDDTNVNCIIVTETCKEKQEKKMVKEIIYSKGIIGRKNTIFYRGEVEEFVSGSDLVIIPENFGIEELEEVEIFTAYKTVDKKVKPVSGTFPQDALVWRAFPHDPHKGLPLLLKNPPDFIPTKHLTIERMTELNINATGFLWPEEEKLFKHIMVLNEKSLAFEEIDRGTLWEDYFSPYIMPTVPHIPWEEKNIPIPPGIKDKVIELLKHKIDAGVYEHCQSAYRSKWFCILKKSGKLRLVHDLQALNAVSIRDAGGPPILDDFVEPFAGRQCYTVFDLFWGFDARRVHPNSRDLTTFSTPLGLLRLTSMPMGYTNSPAEFQKCMTFILRDEIPSIANIFIDDLPIKEPATIYADKNGNPEVLKENPGIRRFIWEHAVDVNRVIHRIKQSGATFSGKKCQICLPDVLIVGQHCTPEGRLPDGDKVEKNLNWPLPENITQVRGFLRLCGTVRIWIAGYSQLHRKITELYHKGVKFVWTPERVEVFEKLKITAASAPALRSIDYSSELAVILAVDTSKHAVGIVLLQIEGRRQPARYGSIPLNEVEQRYSQPKLELYGLYRALRAFQLYLIGVKNLIIEVDAKYIQGMLNAPDLQPNAAMNRWIQGILMFDITLKHVAGKTHQAADALSRRPLGEGEQVVEDDDEWLDNISLYTGISETFQETFSQLKINHMAHSQLFYSARNLPSYSFPATIRQDKGLGDIFRFLTTLEAPYSDSIQGQKRFIKKATQYFVK